MMDRQAVERFVLGVLIIVAMFLVGLGGNWVGRTQLASLPGGSTCRLSEAERRVLAEFWRARDPSTQMDTTVYPMPNMERLRGAAHR